MVAMNFKSKKYEITGKGVMIFLCATGCLSTETFIECSRNFPLCKVRFSFKYTK